MERYRRITQRDRYQIQKYLTAKKKIIWIAMKLGFNRSTIYREKKRGTVVKKNSRTNQTPFGEYSAYKAQEDFKSQNYIRKNWLERKRPKIHGWIEDQIRLQIINRLSPEQISARMKMDQNVKISPEAIYKYLPAGKKTGDELYKQLRRYRRCRRRFKRKSRYWEMQKRRRKSIDDRPKEAKLRKKTGHWERDLMLGKRNSGAVLVIVDRKTHFTLLKKVLDTRAETVNHATEIALRKSKQKYKTITNDNGHEFGEFWNLEEKIKIPVYFCHPLCPWERGTVENTIGLLRQYIPKGSDLSEWQQEDIKTLQTTINSRPRESLRFKTPLEVLNGKTQKIITRKRLDYPPPEYYEQFYLTAEEIEEKRKFREKIVAMGG
jgi:transposase, IS30 family